MTLTSICLVRHGHTIVHGSGGVAGRTDVPLSGEGRAAVARLGASLPGFLEALPLAPRWVTSPLDRTRETAAILRVAAGHPQEPLAVDDRLVELDFGEWEGSTWDAVHREHGEALSAWSDDWVRRAPPAGETFAAQARRCEAWLDALLQEMSRSDTNESRCAVVVTHGGSIRALACRLLGWPLENAMRLIVDPATVCRFERDRLAPNGWRLTAANLREFGTQASVR